MRIQPVQGTGMNAGYDAATKSITISNEGNSPFIYLRVNSKIPVDKEDDEKGYYRFYDFYEVFWDGTDFSELEGGLKATYDSRETCPKLYAMPYDLDDPSNIGNFAGNIGVSGQGLVYAARYRGVDSNDGRDVYEFFRSLDVSSKLLISVDSTTNFVNGYYPCRGYATLDASGALDSKFWAKEINGSELIIGKSYLAFYTGASFDPYPDDPVNSDKRPLVTAINVTMAGPSGVQVVTDIQCTNGTVSATYGTFYPSEKAYIVQDNRKSFISLTDTPSGYGSSANYFLVVNSSGNGITFANSPPSQTFVPSLSFINLKDCPQSYPSGTGEWIVKTNGAALQFVKISYATNAFSVVPDFYTLGTNMAFKLVNDKVTPGANMYYGTNSDGIKGWYSLPS